MKKQILLGLMALTSLGSLQAAEKNNNSAPALKVVPIVSAALRCTSVLESIRKSSKNDISFNYKSENNDITDLQFRSLFEPKNTMSLPRLKWNFIEFNLVMIAIENEYYWAQWSLRRERLLKESSSIASRNLNFTGMLESFYL